jgi:hypothetical protein
MSFTIFHRYLSSTWMNNMCPRWSEDALLTVLRLWIDFPTFRDCVEDKVDWVAFQLALYELPWISPGNCIHSDAALLMDEFARNLRTFAYPRKIFRRMDDSLLDR